MKTHENKEAARKACHAYEKQTAKLREELGVWEENEDSCCAIYTMAQYTDETGATRKFCAQD